MFGYFGGDTSGEPGGSVLMAVRGPGHVLGLPDRLTRDLADAIRDVAIVAIILYSWLSSRLAAPYLQ